MLQEVALAAMAAQTILTNAAAESPQFSLLFPNPTYPSSLSYNLTPQSLPLSLPTAPHPLFVSSSTNKAVAIIKGNSSVQGLATLTQNDNGPTTLSVRISGLAPGPHGFHLHQYGDTTNGCISTGPHFNPSGLKHGAPQDEVRHAGDLGNIIANADGVAEATIVDSQIPLTGANAVIGRALVVHELEDDLGKGGQELSLSTGNAGGRLACGVVALSPV